MPTLHCESAPLPVEDIITACLPLERRLARILRDAVPSKRFVAVAVVWSPVRVLGIPYERISPAALWIMMTAGLSIRPGCRTPRVM